MTVFVSYSSRDRDAVQNLAQDLHDADEQVWMDQRLAGGDAWWRAILEQIRGCDVFIFALSQNSIQSKPCQAELQYAQALGLPILPVQVGLVDSMQLNPLAKVQAVDYRSPTHSTAMRLIAAVHRTRAQRQSLPSPLPPEPEVPFEYLIRLYTTIAGPDQLSPREQAALAAQLQVGLREDGDHDAARRDIVTLLMKLRDRPDVTYQTRTDVDAMLASIDPTPPAPGSLDDRLSPPSAPEPVRQQPADLNLAATQQRPPDRAPVPQPRPADRPPPPRRTLSAVQRALLWAGVLGALVIVASLIVINAPDKQTPQQQTPPTVSKSVATPPAPATPTAAAPPPAPPPPAAPRQVTYSVTGTKAQDDQITITYTDASGMRRILNNAFIPWTITVTPISPSDVGSIEAASLLRLSKLNCSITTSDGTVLSSNQSNQPQVNC